MQRYRDRQPDSQPARQTDRKREGPRHREWPFLSFLIIFEAKHLQILIYSRSHKFFVWSSIPITSPGDVIGMSSGYINHTSIVLCSHSYSRDLFFFHDRAKVNHVFKYSHLLLYVDNILAFRNRLTKERICHHFQGDMNKYPSTPNKEPIIDQIKIPPARSA
jgi:hypothetical protein